MKRVSFFLLFAAVASAKVSLLPQPQYVEAVGDGVAIRKSSVVAIASNNPGHAQVRLASDTLRTALLRAVPGLTVHGVGSKRTGDITIHLHDVGHGTDAKVPLSALDGAAAAPDAHFGQGYVLRMPDSKSVWIAAGSPLGVLYGVTSALQLIETTSAGVRLQGAYIRDFPDFEYRAASDWLLNIEINGWTWDRGRGVEKFARVMEAKIDRALRYKINMALVDGFGFAVGKRPAFYPALMRRLNQYARARGIHLIHGGYGASYGMAYEPVVMYETGVAFKGTVFENRRHYPDGETYRCMGFPKARKGYDPATMGSCRSNEALNRLKAAELREYVQALEPGALYVHHEDFGGFDGTQEAWLQRCDACRRRWPNDSLAAPDGGAGALAHGYSELIKAVARVKNPATGFDGSRDTRVILVSPVYIPDKPTPESWSNVIELWKNIGQQLPRNAATDVCFREVFPLRHGGERFTETFRSVMQRAGLDLNTFLFFTGGADRFITDYPLTGTPAMNALFLGSRGIYNSSGDAYQEPMELINADYSWNARADSTASVPRTFNEAEKLIRSYAYQIDGPPEIFGAGGVYERAVEHLYGPKAAPAMKQYYLESAAFPGVPGAEATRRPMTYLPGTWDRMYAASSHWRQLVQDSKTWRGGVDDESFAAYVTRSKLEPVELHRRLAYRWRAASELNRKGAALLRTALAAPPSPESVEDLRFLQTVRAVCQPLMDSLALFHEAWALRLAGKPAPSQKNTLELAIRARDMAKKEFPEPIDPVGGEVGALRQLSAKLVEAVEAFEKK